MRARPGRVKPMREQLTDVCSCPRCYNNKMSLMSRIKSAVYECLVCGWQFDRDTGTAWGPIERKEGE